MGGAKERGGDEALIGGLPVFLFWPTVESPDSLDIIWIREHRVSVPEWFAYNFLSLSLSLLIDTAL